mgnify:CR=1 FL=1
MSTSTYEGLIASGFNPQQPLQVRKTVVTQELGKKYTLEITNGYPSTVFQVDGVIIKTGRKCDKLVLVKTKEWTQIFVELKGHDAIHGMEQLLATAKNSTFASPSNKIRKARLIATSCPSNKANPLVERLKRDFSKMKIDYKSLKPGQKDRL